ncbi:MAG: hypothetical protein COT14_01355 [Candidatus Diapherotrites archaeon CG08_land_8_20_14_0_20_30_16]|nr:MAG: hypothetical protein COT14_01355 [Candidatus Diapherotrites archaeon CG08_land_8_20_14_0_20_30_16]
MVIKKKKDDLMLKSESKKPKLASKELMDAIFTENISREATNAISKYPFKYKKELDLYKMAVNWPNIWKFNEFAKVVSHNYQNLEKLFAKLEEEFGFEKYIISALAPEIDKIKISTNKELGLDFESSPELVKETELNLKYDYKRKVGRAIKKLKPYKDKYPKEKIIEVIKFKIYIKRNWLYKVWKRITDFFTFSFQKEEQILDLKIIVELVEDLPKNVVDTILKYSVEDKKNRFWFGIQFLKPEDARKIILTNYKNSHKLLKELKSAILKEIDKQPKNKETNNFKRTH